MNTPSRLALSSLALFCLAPLTAAHADIDIKALFQKYQQLTTEEAIQPTAPKADVSVQQLFTFYSNIASHRKQETLAQKETKLHPLFNEITKLQVNIDEKGKAELGLSSLFPGRIIGDTLTMHKIIFEDTKTHPELLNEVNFFYPWSYREQSYELFFASQHDLAACIFNLAMFTKDIGPQTPYDKFLKAVSGFHYSTDQIVAWLNSLKPSDALHEEEMRFVALLLKDGILSYNNGVFSSHPKIKHVLAAAEGRKRAFFTNLRHERYHVLWDLNPEIQKQYTDAIAAMNEEERRQAFHKLKGYNQENLPQLTEEWAVCQMELLPMKAR